MTEKRPARSADNQARKEQRVFEEMWMRRVLHEPGLTAAEKVGALAYLDFIHRKRGKDFRCAWVSGPTLVARCNLGDRTLDRLFTKLRNLGYLELVRRRGYNGTNMHRFVMPELPGWDWLDNLSSEALTPMSQEDKAVRKLLAEPRKTGRPPKRKKIVEPQKTGNPANAVGPQETGNPQHGQADVEPQKTWGMEPQKTGNSAPQKTGAYPLDDPLDVNTGKRRHGQEEASNTRPSSSEPVVEGEPGRLGGTVVSRRVPSMASPSRCGSRPNDFVPGTRYPDWVQSGVPQDEQPPF